MITPEFLLEMSKQMNEQHNRYTADPIWQVRCRRWRPTDKLYSDNWELIDRRNDCEVIASSADSRSVNKQIIDFLNEDPDDLTIILEQWVDDNYDEDKELTGQEKIDFFLSEFDHDYDSLTDDFEKVYIEEYEEVVKGAFLTEQDANWFIKRKQHDYPKLYTYVESMCYCPQMIQLRDWIMSLEGGEK